MTKSAMLGAQVFIISQPTTPLLRAVRKKKVELSAASELRTTKVQPAALRLNLASLRSIVKPCLSRAIACIFPFPRMRD